MKRQCLCLMPFAVAACVFSVSSLCYGQTAGQCSQLIVRQLDEGIYLGAAPKTDADFAKLRQIGVRRVIDVRTFKVLASSVERRRAGKYGIRYQRIPTGFLPTKTGNVPRIMSELCDRQCGAVYLHCNLGSDRTGMIAAIYRTERLGWDAQLAFETWKSDQFNPNLKDLDRYFWQRVGGVVARPQ